MGVHVGHCLGAVGSIWGPFTARLRLRSDNPQEKDLDHEIIQCGGRNGLCRGLS